MDKTLRAHLTAKVHDLSEKEATILLNYLIGWCFQNEDFWLGVHDGYIHIVKERANTKEAK